jgi:polysaccharide export outer membrane protein
MRCKALALSVLFCAPLWCQQRAGQERRKAAPSAGEDAPVAPKAVLPASDNAFDAGLPAFSDYRLGPEDLVWISVLDSPEFSRPVRVSGAGTIRLPLVKRPIQAQGKTSTELEQEIARVLIDEGLLRDPEVAVSIREFHSKPVSVSGAVRGPVVFQAVRPVTLNEAIDRAGGLAENAGTEIVVSFPERDGQPPRVMRVPVKALDDVPGGKTEIWIRGGEDIRVPQAGRVYLLGGVTKPGAVLISGDQPLTLLRALALAGGVTPAAGSKAFLLRNPGNGGQKQELALNLKKLMKRQNPDLPLQSEDVIFIPDSNSKKLAQTGMAAAVSGLIYTATGALIWR